MAAEKRLTQVQLNEIGETIQSLTELKQSFDITISASVTVDGNLHVQLLYNENTEEYEVVVL